MRVWGEGEGKGKVVEQQTGALGNPRSSFSSSSSSLCIRWGFDKIFTLGNAVHIYSYNVTKARCDDGLTLPFAEWYCYASVLSRFTTKIPEPDTPFQPFTLL